MEDSNDSDTNEPDNSKGCCTRKKKRCGLQLLWLTTFTVIMFLSSHNNVEEDFIEGSIISIQT